MPEEPEPLEWGLRLTKTVYSAVKAIAKSRRDSIAETADKLLMEHLQKNYAEYLEVARKGKK